MGAFDALRGFSVISMVLFHYCYDVRFIAGHDLPFFEPPLQYVWRCSISWAFVFIAGCMSVYSRSNARRSLKYLTLAAAIFVVTSVVSVDTPISFGVIFCMGACTLVSHLINSAGLRPRGWLPAILLLVLFVFAVHVPEGYVGVPGMTVRLPRELYSTPWLSWLGFPGPQFSSGDYYPLIPYLFLYLSGQSWAREMKSVGYPAWFTKLRLAPLEFIGRHALEIYVIHQPILLLISGSIA
ncbi:MAG: DUF1624 domain-containing protein [Olsenella sp.]|nr:DUF1624 domain-containing protein [Olsenella sp.]